MTKELRSTVNYRLSADCNISQTLVILLDDIADAAEVGAEQRMIIAAWAGGWDAAQALINEQEEETGGDT